MVATQQYGQPVLLQHLQHRVMGDPVPAQAFGQIAQTLGIARATRVGGAAQIAQIADLHTQPLQRRTELGHAQGIGPHGRAKARGPDIGGQTDQCGRCACHEPLRFRPSYGPQD